MPIGGYNNKMISGGESNVIVFFQKIHYTWDII